MKALGLALVVGGWVIAVGGLVASEALALRLATALLGLAASLGGILTINQGHNEHAIWKRKGALS
jgi:hypothetical protein